jgi:hypothetical protein
MTGRMTREQAADGAAALTTGGPVRPRAIAVGAAFAALMLGCSSQNHDRADAGGNAPGAGGSVAPIDAATDSGSVAIGQPVWTDASQHITVSCNVFPSDQMGFDADRAQLTDQQLMLLGQMRIAPPVMPAIVDGLDCFVQITGIDGDISPYEAVPQDAASPGTAPLISYATFQPFLATIPCLFSYDEGMDHAIAPDVRCTNGIYLRPIPGNVDRFLTITDPAPQRHLSLDQCDSPAASGLLHLKVLAGDDSDGGTATVLAQATTPSAPTSDHTCQSLDITFPAAGTYLMRVATPQGSPVDGATFRFF